MKSLLYTLIAFAMVFATKAQAQQEDSIPRFVTLVRWFSLSGDGSLDIDMRHPGKLLNQKEEGAKLPCSVGFSDDPYYVRIEHGKYYLCTRQADGSYTDVDNTYYTKYENFYIWPRDCDHRSSSL